MFAVYWEAAKGTRVMRELEMELKSPAAVSRRPQGGSRLLADV